MKSLQILKIVFTRLSHFLKKCVFDLRFKWYQIEITLHFSDSNYLHYTYTHTYSKAVLYGILFERPTKIICIYFSLT